MGKNKKETIRDPWEEVKVLQKKVDELTDENSSLWFLLDELEKSDITNFKNRETLSEAFDKLKIATLMLHRKTEQA
jgi:hypothetical protein